MRKVRFGFLLFVGQPVTLRVHISPHCGQLPARVFARESWVRVFQELGGRHVFGRRRLRQVFAAGALLCLCTKSLCVPRRSPKGMCAFWRVILVISASEVHLVWGLGKDSRSRARLVVVREWTAPFPVLVLVLHRTLEKIDLRLSFCACASRPSPV